MTGPKRLSRLSQFWLPSLLFVLSVVSILFTLRNDEIPVLGPDERAVLDTSELDKKRKLINQALHHAGTWQTYCERRTDALQALHINGFETKLEDPRWTEFRRSVPQREQDALLRCQSASASCVYLLPIGPSKNPGLHLLEISLELRQQGKRKSVTCAEALAGTGPVELAAWYSYYWTAQTGKKNLHFERLTGGTRMFPPLAQNAERASPNSRLESERSAAGH